VLLCSPPAYDWCSHDLDPAAFTPTTVIAKLPEFGSRVLSDAYDAHQRCGQRH
jgi:hypothetical protein